MTIEFRKQMQKIKRWRIRKQSVGCNCQLEAEKECFAYRHNQVSAQTRFLCKCPCHNDGAEPDNSNCPGYVGHD